jgi:hypothetical protein
MLNTVALLIGQNLTDFEPPGPGIFPYFELLGPAILAAAFLYLYWLAITYLARRFQTEVRWHVVRRWWPFAMTLLILPFALQNTGVLPSNLTVNVLVVLGVVLNLPVLIPLGFLREATGFDLYGWTAALWPATAWLGWQLLVRVVQRRIEADHSVSLGI